MFYKQYFQKFYLEADDKVKDKIDYIFRLIKTVEKVPEKFLKHLEGTEGLYEIRIEVGSNIYRIFCCFDRGHIVVLFNAFQKKSQKTPPQEIVLAEKLKTEYFILEDKQDGKERGNTKR
ncbi:MAG TPA: type II toxin-antitoxin system RelE/ParE family toxin [Mucilaginibacter sp.]|nr:type II toxin-antitoxin system RelE/ParE family toxin [Mucilaginibacter sp.]